MSHRPLAAIVVATLLLSTVAPQALALDIRVMPNGTIVIGEGAVLGESEESEESKESKDSDSVEIKKSDSGKQVERSTESKNETKSETKKGRSIAPQKNQELRVTTKKNSSDVEIGRRENKKSDQKEAAIEKVEQVETDEVKLRYPAELTPEQRRAREEERQEKREDQEDESVDDAEQEQEERAEKLETEREERKGEQVELRTKRKEGPDGEESELELELQSRNVTAKLQGAEFALDPETNTVTITTPSGQEHTLSHLPDQAVQRMEDAGLLTLRSDEEQQEVVVETTEDGQVLYTTIDTKEKKLFGVFKRKVPTKVSLDDSTGEVTEEEEPADTLLVNYSTSSRFSVYQDSVTILTKPETFSVEESTPPWAIRAKNS